MYTFQLNNKLKETPSSWWNSNDLYCFINFFPLELCVALSGFRCFSTSRDKKKKISLGSELFFMRLINKFMVKVPFGFVDKKEPSSVQKSFCREKEFCCLQCFITLFFYKILSHFRASLPGRNIHWEWASWRTPCGTVCRFTSWIITCMWPTWKPAPAVQQSEPVQWSTREKRFEQEHSATDTATERKQHWSSC